MSFTRDESPKSIGGEDPDAGIQGLNIELSAQSLACVL